jgi:hypothetical protein
VRLTSDKRQKNQLVLAFQEESRSEAPTASGEGTESLAAKRRSEHPAIGERRGFRVDGAESRSEDSAQRYKSKPFFV